MAEDSPATANDLVPAFSSLLESRELTGEERRRVLRLLREFSRIGDPFRANAQAMLKSACFSEDPEVVKEAKKTLAAYEDQDYLDAYMKRLREGK